MPDDAQALDSGGTAATAYAEAVSVYLAFAVDKAANYWSSLCSWHSGRDTVTSTFGQFCLHWFEQHGWTEGAFGDGDTLSRSKGTSVDGMKEAGVLQSGGGKVRLLKWPEYPTGWDPSSDTRTPVWEALHQLIRVGRLARICPAFSGFSLRRTSFARRRLTRYSM